MSNPLQKFCSHCGEGLEKYLSIKSAMKLLDCSEEFLRKRILNRTISFVKIGRLVRIPYSEIEKLIEYYPSFNEQEKQRLRRYH